MKGKIFGLAVAFLILGAALFGADAVDDRVSKQLKKLGIAYSPTDAKNFSVEQELRGGRTQVVYIMSKTNTYDSLEIREIWSNAGSFDEEPPADTLMALLSGNDNEKIGAWTLEAADDGSYLAYFSIKVPTYLKDKDLASMIEFAATVADEMEVKLFDNSDEN